MGKRVENILSGNKAKKKIIKGINILSNIIGDTIGPRGKNVVIDSGKDYPLITNDGASIAKEIFLTSPFEDIGMNILKEASLKTNELIGDGTTTAIVLANSMLKYGKHYLKKGKNVNLLKDKLMEVFEKSSKYLSSISKKDLDGKDIENLAYVASGNLGHSKILKEIYEKADLSSCFIEENIGGKTSFEIYDGIFLEGGYTNSYFNTNDEEYINIQNPYILLYDGEFENIKNILHVLEDIKKENGSIILISSSFSKDAEKSIVYNFANNILNIYSIKMPEYFDSNKDVFMDLSLSLGAKIFSNNDELLELKLEDIKKVKSVKCSKDKTYIFKNEDSNILSRKENIKNKIKKEKDKSKKLILKKRLGILDSKISIIKVGSQTEAENRNLKLKLEDALSTCIAGISSGVLEGGGLSFLKLSKKLEEDIKDLKKDKKNSLKKSKEEIKVEIDANKIIKDSLKEPFRKIIINSSKNPKKIYRNIEKNNFELGFDAENLEYVNMFEKGIIDSTLGEQIALKTAISVASMILTMSSVIYKDLDYDI